MFVLNSLFSKFVHCLVFYGIGDIIETKTTLRSKLYRKKYIYVRELCWHYIDDSNTWAMYFAFHAIFFTSKHRTICIFTPQNTKKNYSFKCNVFENCLSIDFLWFKKIEIKHEFLKKNYWVRPDYKRLTHYHLKKRNSSAYVPG